MVVGETAVLSLEALKLELLGRDVLALKVVLFKGEEAYDAAVALGGIIGTVKVEVEVGQFRD